MYDLMGLFLIQCVSTLCSFTCNKERSVPFVTQFWRNSHGIFSDGKPHFVALFVVWRACILIIVGLLLVLCLFPIFSSNFSDEFAQQVIHMNFEIFRNSCIWESMIWFYVLCFITVHVRSEVFEAYGSIHSVNTKMTFTCNRIMVGCN